MKIIQTAVDIESLGNPENSGYAVVIPNYALVRIPDNVRDGISDWMYAQIPVQDQLDIGLKVGASTLDFWHNDCAKNFPDAHAEMIKSYSLQNVRIHSNVPYIDKTSMYPPYAVKQFLYGEKYDNDYDNILPHLYGNGCHFDCSILQENHRVLYGNGEMWHYSSPQNARTLKARINDAQHEEMNELVKTALESFVKTLPDDVGTLCLHHPLYDAAREALQIAYCIEVLDQHK